MPRSIFRTSPPARSRSVVLFSAMMARGHYRLFMMPLSWRRHTDRGTGQMPVLRILTHAIDGGFEAADIDRLGEMLGKSGSAAALNIVFHAKAAESNCLGPAALGKLRPQTQAVSIGKADVGDDQMKIVGVDHVQRRSES